MKNACPFVTICLLLWGILSLGFAQTEEKTSKEENEVTIDDFYIDFSVPDLFAFTLIGVNLNSIARPGNIKEFSIATLDFIDKKGTIKPGIALEWSPFKTFASKSLESYRKHKLLHAIQISLATVKDSDATKVGLGLRWVPIDKSDSLMSEDEEMKTIKHLAKYDLSSSSAERRPKFIKKINSFFSEIQCDPDKRIKLLNLIDISNPPKTITVEAIEKEIKDEIKKQNIDFLEDKEQKLLSYIREYIVIIKGGESPEKEVSRLIYKAKEDFEKLSWNADVFYIGLGTLGISEDSTWRNLKLNTFSGVMGYTFPFPKKSRSSQFILQLQGRKSFRDDSEEKWFISFGGRFLIGNSKNRFSIEGMYSKTKHTQKEMDGNKGRVTIGGEFKLSKGLWLEIALGTITNRKLSDSSILSLFSIKYALQKKRRYDTP